MSTQKWRICVSEIQKEEIKIKVSVVVILIDDFTDKIIPAGQAVVAIEGEKKPILKSDGYYVFTNIQKKEICIHAEMFGYQNVKMCKTINEEGQMEIIKIHLVPNENYHFDEAVTFVKGVSKPYGIIEMVFRNNRTPLRLLEDYEGKTKDCIRIYNPLCLEVADKKLVIETGDKFEIVSVIEKKENDYYCISDVLKNDYKKSDTSIHMVHRIICDETGQYQVPIPRLINKDKVVCEILENDKIKKKVSLEFGCVNEINLLR